MSLAVLGWGLIGGGFVVGLYGLLLRTYTQKFWDSQGLAVVYLLLMVLSLALVGAAQTGVTVFTGPHIPSLILLLWFFCTVTYVPVRITRAMLKHGKFKVLTPTVIFIIAVFASFLLALLFSVAFLSGSLVFAP